MKLNMRLGVPSEALLKHPTACFRLSKAATRVSDALSFGEYYLFNHKGDLRPKDLQHMSASIHTSARSAEDLAKLVDDAELRKEIEAYTHRAERINASIRKALPSPKFREKKPKAPPLAEMISRAKELREKFKAIDKKVEDLCTVTKPPPAPAPTPTPVGSSTVRSPRVGMSGVVHKKKPLYPRYFVASMGRARR